MSYQQVPASGTLIDQFRSLSMADWTVVDQKAYLNVTPFDGRWIIRSPATWPTFYIAVTQVPNDANRSRCHIRTYDTWDTVTHTGTGGAHWASDATFSGSVAWGTPASPTTITPLHCIIYTDTIFFNYGTTSSANLVMTKFTGVGWSPANPYVLVGTLAVGSGLAYGGLIYEHTTGDLWQQAGLVTPKDSGNGTPPPWMNATGASATVAGSGFVHMPYHVIAIRQGFVNEYIYVGQLQDTFSYATVEGSTNPTWFYDGRTWKGFRPSSASYAGLPNHSSGTAFAVAFA